MAQKFCKKNLFSVLSTKYTIPKKFVFNILGKAVSFANT